MQQKKKLLIFHPYLAPYRIDLYNSLSRKFDINVLLTGSNRELATLGYDLQAVNQQAKFPYRYYSKGFFVGRHLISSVYYKIIKSFKPDTILAHELGINTLIAILLKKMYHYKVYVTIDDSPLMAAAYQGLRKMLRRFVIRHVNGLIVVNPQVRDYLAQKFNGYSCQYHSLPIIQDERVLEEKLNSALLASKSIDKQYNFRGKKLILFIGRLIHAKAPDLLLKVFAELYIENPDLRLIYIGDGELKKNLMEYTITHHLHDVVYFLGRLNGTDLFAWYNIGQILVLPSRYEPFGAVVNEALATGCMVVTSDSTGASCLIDEKNGIVFKTNDDNSLKNALLQTIAKISPIEDIRVKNSIMNESFSDHVRQLINFICS